MSPENSLHVWFGLDLVGKLWRGSTEMIGFSYEKTWINKGFAISQQLPLNIADYSPESGVAHQFFVNLLPEAGARSQVVRDLKISNSDFELLRAIGGDCAGALSILPIHHQPNKSAQYSKLSAEDLKKIVLQKSYFFVFPISKNRPRLSLAGAQDKCPIFFDGSNYFLPQDAAPSTHIIKFEIAGYKNIPIYEYFLSKLASAVGLLVVDIGLHRHNQGYYLLIKRYDRIINQHQQVQRLHQEDFCQALGVSYARKYQQEGGPSFQDCYNLMQRISNSPIKDQENLLRWQVFNVLAGNSDGHAKNLSILYNENHQIELAPFYDLVCTRAVERLDTRIAMSVGGEFNPDNITIKHWKNLAKDCHIRETYLKKIIQEMGENLLDKLLQTQQTFEESFGSFPALQRVHKVITKQCKRVLKQL